MLLFFSIPLTLERVDIHKSARGWSSRMTLKVLFNYHLCLFDSVVGNIAVYPYTCPSIPLWSSNSTWQMQRTKKKIKVSSRKRTCFSQPWRLISVSSPVQVSPVRFAGTVCHSMHETALTGFQAPEKKSSWQKVFCMLSFKHSAMSSQRRTHEGVNRTGLAPCSRSVSKVFCTMNEWTSEDV